jgi:hypothetical protein
MSIDANSTSLINFQQFYVVKSEPVTTISLHNTDNASEYFEKVGKLINALKNVGNETEAEAVSSKVTEWLAYKWNTAKPLEPCAIKVDIIREAMMKVPEGSWATVPYVPQQHFGHTFTYLLHKGKGSDTKVHFHCISDDLLLSQHYWKEIMIPGHKINVEGYP